MKEQSYVFNSVCYIVLYKDSSTKVKSDCTNPLLMLGDSLKGKIFKYREDQKFGIWFFFFFSCWLNLMKVRTELKDAQVIFQELLGQKIDSTPVLVWHLVL